MTIIGLAAILALGAVAAFCVCRLFRTEDGVKIEL